MRDLLVSPDESRALDRLSEGLREYQKASGKLSRAILVQKGGHLLYGNQKPQFGPTFDGLTQQFIKQEPEEGSIWAAARARGFRVGRKQYGGGLNPRAEARAREMMQGNKTILASVNPTTGALKFVRRGVRKARVYFRHGRKSYAASGDFVGPLLEHDRRMNFRAVAVFFELWKREQGRRFLGASWMHRRWRRLAQSDPRRGGGTFRVLQNVNPRSTVQPLGKATLDGSEATGNLELWISSYVPGVKTIGQKRGLFVAAIDGVRRDLDAYIARKHAETIAEALMQGKLSIVQAEQLT